MDWAHPPLGRLRGIRAAGLMLLLASGLTACATTQSATSMASGREALRGTEKPYQVNGQWYYPKPDPRYDEVGVASWYGYPFHHRRTANGEVFDQNLISAAHKTLPLPCIVEVTDLENGRRIRVRVNDRGPFAGGRLIDLSKAAAQQLGFDRKGVAPVRVRYIAAAPPLTAGLMQASYAPARAPAVAETRPIAQTQRTEPQGFDTYDPEPATNSEWDSPLSRPTSPEAAPTTPIADIPAPVATTNAPLPAASLVSESGTFAVQAGAFSSRVAANRVAAQLADAGSPQVLPIERNGATLYRVTVGAFNNPEAAADARSRIVASGFSDARVVQAF